MKYANMMRKTESNDQLWYFLAECSLSEFIREHDKGDGLSAGSLDRTIRELGIPTESVENIERTLTRFAREALARFKQGRNELPVRIRVFFQKEKVDEKLKGGWGYFLIGRTEGSSDSLLMRSQHFVDLYIYREGE